MIVMGVAGSGKSTVGAALAASLDAEFIDADAHHPPSNVEKMAAGVPLTDADRAPWLDTVAAIIVEHHVHGRTTVLACSALRRSYRDRLRSAVPAEESFAVHLAADPDVLRARLVRRRGHFMPARLLESQLETLEPLAPDEAGATVDASCSIEEVVAAAVVACRSEVPLPSDVRPGHGRSRLS